ncbi:MAG: hypothetical protein R3305_02820, partial [Gammaproteobacteria bacterium]|nr:hypothetical protein [Gammaproteobacteria bacterium]
MNWRRISRLGLGAFAVVIVAVVAGVAWLVGTDSGARFVFGRVAAATDGAFSFGTLSGRLSDQVELTDLRYDDGRTDVDIDRVSLRVDVTALLRGALIVEDLRSGIVRYRPAPAGMPLDDPAPPGEPFSLPVAIFIDRASIESIVVTTDEAGAEPLTIERIVLSATASGRSLAVQRLEARVDEFDLSTQGDYGWEDGFEADALLSWSGRLDGRSWLGSVEVQGRWPEFSVEPELLEPFVLNAGGTAVLAPEPSVDLEFAARRVEVPGSDGVVLETVDGTIAGGLGNFIVDITTDAGRLNVAGSYAPDDRSWQATVDVSEFSPAIVVEDWPGTWSARGGLSGQFGDTLTVAAEALTVGIALDAQSVDVEVSGRWSADGVVVIDGLDAAVGDNRIAANGRIDDRIELQVEAELPALGALVDLAEHEAVRALSGFDRPLGELSGRASAALSISGPRQQPDISGSFSLTESRYAGLPLSIELDLAPTPLAANWLSVSRGLIRYGTTEVAVTGTVGETLAVSVDAMFADLAELAALTERDEIRRLTGLAAPVTGVAGAATAAVTVGGRLAAPEIEGAVQLSEFAYGQWEVPAANVDGRVGAYAGGPTTVSADVTTELGRLVFAADGRIEQDGWRGRVDTLSLQQNLVGNWALVDPVALTLTRELIEIGAACLVANQSEVCGEWRYSSGGDTLRLTARSFELETLNPLLPETVSLVGRVDLDANLDSLTQAPAGSLSATADGAAVTFDVGINEQATTVLDTARVEATLQGNALEASAELSGRDTGRVSLAMSTDDIRRRDAPIAGRVDVFWPDLGVLALLSPEVGAVGGTLSVAINVSGTADEPVLDGNAVWDEGSVTVPQWGVVVDRIRAEADSRDGRTVEFDGVAFVDDS